MTDRVFPLRWLAVPQAWLMVACSALEPSPPQASPTFPVLLSVKRDALSAIAGAQIFEGSNLLGTTDDTGTVQLELSGVEGGSAALSVKCPDGFASPQRPLTVGLRRLAPNSPAPRFNSECVPLVHTVVAAVRAENGPNLPISFLNRVVGHTDEFGVGHVLLETAANQPITLTLDTREHPSVSPQNPALTFVAPEDDALVLLDQTFVVKKPKAPRPRRAPRPTRIGL
jgi:hypothetical protein